MNITKNVLFIHGGGGECDYEADAGLVRSLEDGLGAAYKIHYPLLSDESSPDFGRKRQIGMALSLIKGDVVLVGHSLGASMLLKYLSESRISKKIHGVFLLSTPFWTGDEDWVKGLKLQENFAENLPVDVPVFLYHCRDDNEIPFFHLELYSKQLPDAIVRIVSSGGHQFNNDLSVVADDIKSLW